MKLSVHSLLPALLMLSDRILSLPTGAPICSIDIDRIAAGHTMPSADETLDYELKADKVNDNTYTISFTSKVESLFKGVLIYVIANDSKTHVGSFKLPNDNFKFQTDICESEGVNGAPESTVTHSNPSDKSLSEIKFTWSFLQNQEKGPFKVMAVVAKERNPWKLVKELVLDQKFVPPYPNMSSTSCSSTMTSSISSCSTAASSASTDQTVHKIFKCTMVKKEWKTKY